MSETEQTAQAEPVIREEPATDPARPAFALRSATMWHVVLGYRAADVRDGADQLHKGAIVNLSAHLLTADPTGVEVHAVARAFVERQVPGAREVTLVRVERHGEAFGTASVPGGAS